MMSRAALVLAASVAMVSAASYRMTCIDGLQTSCAQKCCARGWELEGSEGTYTCKQEGTGAVCELCGQGSKPCDFNENNCGLAAAPELLDENGATVAASEKADDGSNGVGGAAGGTGSLPDTTPSSGVTITLGTYNGMDGWLDIEPSRFFGFHGYLLGIAATVPSFYTKAGFSVKYSCQKKAFSPATLPPHFTACDIFFFMYRCPPCESETSGMGAHLLSMAQPTWYAGNCGASFKLDMAKGAEHRFAVYEAELPVDTSLTVKTPGPVEFIFWAMVAKNVICADNLDEASCNAWSENCEWLDSGACRPKLCEKRSEHQGPPTPTCAVCIYDDELTLLPKLIL